MLRFISLSLCIALIQGLVLGRKAFAQETSYRILLVNEDGQPSSIERNSREDLVLRDWIFEGIQAGGGNWNVVDETAVTNELFVQGRTRRKKDELIATARALRAPAIDILMVYSLEFDSTISKLSQLARLDVFIALELIDLATGEVLASTIIEDLGGRKQAVRPDCLEESRRASRCRGEHLARRLNDLDLTAVQHLLDVSGARIEEQMVAGCGRASLLKLGLEGADTEELRKLQFSLEQHACVEKIAIQRAGSFSTDLTVSFAGTPGQLALALEDVIRKQKLEGPVRLNTKGALEWLSD